MQSFWTKSGQPKADARQTLVDLATFCEKKKVTEEQLQRRIEQLTEQIRSTPRKGTLSGPEKKKCIKLLLEKRQCERNLDSVSEQRLRATFAYNAIQHNGHQKEFVSLMKNANECMQGMGLPTMRDQAERASDTASDLAVYSKELEDALHHFGGSFSTDDTELDDELDEILGMPGDGVSPAVLSEAPGAVVSSSSSVSSSIFPRAPRGSLTQIPASAIKPSPQLAGKDTKLSVVSV
jgi:hypothetical protein